MDIDTLYEITKLAAERKKFERWRFFVPVPKQEEFLTAGATFAERMLMAGNGNGKTETAAFEATCHLTGNYPTWWKGYRFNRPTRGWVGGTSGRGARSAGQEKLFGTPGDPSALGTGMIPKENIVGVPSTGRSAPNSIDSAIIKHVSGGNSRVELKTYSQDREDWQGSDVEWVWFDEEPPMEIYTEGLARLRGKGISWTTFTPLHGVTDLVRRFTDESNPNRLLVKMRLADAIFLSKTQVDTILEQYPVREREARINGMPMLGAGKVFLTPDEELRELPIRQVPLEWGKLWGLDFGSGGETGHPFAAVLYALDRENDIVHILHTYKTTEILPLIHASHMKRIAGGVPVAWPHDGHDRERSSGEPLARIYKKLGLHMLENHATHLAGGYSTYAGIQDIDDYMRAGRFKVSSLCSNWFDEYGGYHYDEKGDLVKIRDDLMSATRIAHMMRRRAKPVPLGAARKVEQETMCRDIDFPLFS